MITVTSSGGTDPTILGSGTSEARFGSTVGPTSQPGLKFGGDSNIYRRAATELKTDGYFEAALDIVARQGTGQATSIGSVAGLPAVGFPAGNAIVTGTGTPEGVVTLPVGSMFLRTNGGALTTLYIKESGAGNTGWVAK